MSMAQMKPDFAPISDAGSKAKYLFMYDHHLCVEEFCMQFGARAIGVGWLPCWTWHVNTEGKANIRYTFMANQHYFSDSPPIAPALDHVQYNPNGTFGYLCMLNAELEAKLVKHYADSRIYMTKDITVAVFKDGNLRQVPLTSLVFYDPWYTADNNINMIDDKDEAMKWAVGLTHLRRHGVPMSWISSVQNHLAGLGSLRELEPLQSFIHVKETELQDTGAKRKAKSNLSELPRTTGGALR